jgi:hypothetical protein
VPHRAELDRQVQNLVDRGYHELVGMSEDAFRGALRQLAATVDTLPPGTAVAADDHIPFVIVVNRAPTADAAARMTLKDSAAILMLAPEEVARFTPVAGVSVPEGLAYLLVDIDTGSEFCNVAPARALPVVDGRGRTVLTIAEGVALVTHRPDMLRKNKCFSLLASRCGDKRVPAIWISGRAPKLGWCWAGNPHSWLGSASAGARIAASGA